MSQDRTFDIRFQANPTQKRFIESQAEADLFACRMGEGKSAALAWSIFHHTRQNPGAVWMMIRDTWENMRDTTQKEFFGWFPPGIMGEYRSSEKRFVWGEATGLSGEVQFGGMDDPADAANLQSRSLAGVAMDEPAPAAESGGIDELIFDVALSRLRQPGMSWYAMKLAENNPDETHWTYRRFVDPGTEGFVCWQTAAPENLGNLPDGYYEKVAKAWAHRPDLQRRFLEGKFGFQQHGKAVTPEWAENLHLARQLDPSPGSELVLLWDGGQTPTCLITQVTPLGHWLVLESHVGEDIGMTQLVEDIVKPRMRSRFHSFRWRHTGDPNLSSPEQSDSRNSATKVITGQLGGPFIPGPISVDHRVEPLRAILRRTQQGRGVVQVDSQRAKEVWHALRGGWHYHIDRSGNIGDIVKDMHSHPGDCMGYGASLLFPLSKIQRGSEDRRRPQQASYFRGRRRPGDGLGIGRPDVRMPREGRKIGGGGNR